MSQANVEIVKRVIDDYNRRDLDAYDQFFTSDFELFPAFRGAVEGGSYRGREGIERALDATRDTWEDFRLIADEFGDLGDRVLVVGRVKARGRGSGVPVDAPTETIFDFRDGKISRVRAYLDHGDALKAVGLER